MMEGKVVWKMDEREVVRISEKVFEVVKAYVDAEPDRYLTAQEVAEYMGISVSMVYKLKTEEGLPFHKYGRNVRFKRSEIDAWIQSKSSRRLS